jgi:hypothetical protein
MIIIVPVCIILTGLIYSIKVIKKYWMNNINYLPDYTNNNRYFNNLEQKNRYNVLINNQISKLNAGKTGLGIIIISIGLFCIAYLYELGYYQFICDWINIILTSK